MTMAMTQGELQAFYDKVCVGVCLSLCLSVSVSVSVSVCLSVCLSACPSTSLFETSNVQHVGSRKCNSAGAVSAGANTGAAGLALVMVPCPKPHVHTIESVFWRHRLLCVVRCCKLSSSLRFSTDKQGEENRASHMPVVIVQVTYTQDIVKQPQAAKPPHPACLPACCAKRCPPLLTTRGMRDIAPAQPAPPPSVLMMKVLKLMLVMMRVCSNHLLWGTAVATVRLCCCCCCCRHCAVAWR